MPSSQVANDEDAANGFNDLGRESPPQVDEHGFMFAPKKPEGDLWEVALEPFMKREREQCDAWKEEVQNLLIFAGLFSAVVTAFVIESYKSLQVDPQDTMVSLLSNILVRLENGTATATPTPNLPSGQVPFVPDKSAERINSFWFISLVLSLATALIGIISLQWLREYQSYANFNSEETFALFNMRKDGFERWHVPKVFAALPLLLQGALVLFLAGMVDFSLALGIKVGIPVTVAIALTLAFLLLTTILPTFQGLLYLFRLPRTKSPQHLVPQCPYKSPQSRAFRVVALPLYAFFMAVLGPLEDLASRLEPMYRFFVKPREENSASTAPTPLVAYGDVLYRLFSRRTWSEYDQAWLQLRFNVSQALFHSVTTPGQFIFPNTYFQFTPYVTRLTDLLGCLRRIMESNAPETSMEAAYHCFIRVSLSLMDSFEKTTWLSHQILPYFYLQTILIGDEPRQFLLSECLDMSAMNESVYTALHYEALTFFMSIPGSPAWRNHCIELEILLKGWIYSDHRELQSPALALSFNRLPRFIRMKLHPFFNQSNPLPDSPLALMVHIDIYGPAPISTPPVFPEGLISKYCTIYFAFFTCISKGDQYADWTTSIHMTPEVTAMLMEAARVGYHNLLVPTSIAIADIIIDCLQKYLDMPSDERNGDGPTYNLLFYAASIYLSAFPKTTPCPWTRSIHSVYEKLEDARKVLVQYKARVLDVVGPDQVIERHFVDYYDPLYGPTDMSQLDVLRIPRRFSAEWWSFLEVPFVYPGGEVVEIWIGEPEGAPIATTPTSIPDLPSTSNP
ncbi:hypothetical protein D9613_009698 [Agrocybe pediades]|uniref:DUF6535 domain-containing protein n=1 Tax=Agrocybe pediades TaxID=84607 RepID=A0A8H4VQQ4_9AGAR|nr:hypothetical protein D9613_009698 [Agrocybe pediades]